MGCIRGCIRRVYEGVYEGVIDVQSASLWALFFLDKNYMSVISMGQFIRDGHFEAVK